MNILICAPHTDDESLGCGASISRWVREGHQVHVLCFSTCYDSLPHHLQGRRSPYITEFELGDACDILGCTFSIHDTRVRHFPEHRQKILETLNYYKRNYKPDIVVGPSLNDIHQDHKVVAEEMRRCFWRSCSIISYELPWNSDGFRPNMYISVSCQDIENKWEAIVSYESQKTKDVPYLNIVYGDDFTAYRGSDIGLEYAEAFEVIRWRY